MRILAQHLIEFRPECEHLVPILQGELACLGQFKGSPLAIERGGADSIFKLLDLAAKRLGRDADCLAGTDHAATLGDLPEVEQMLEFHVGNYTRKP